MENDLKNNISTVLVLVYGIISPYIAQYLSQEQFSALGLAIISIALVIFSARNPNTMKIFGNDDTCDCIVNEDKVLNDEYESDGI